MKSKTIIVIMLILSVLLTSCNTGLTPKALAASTQDIVEDVKVDSTDIFEEIEYNLALLDSLKDKVQRTQANGQKVSLDSVIRDMTKITESFEALSTKRDDIRKMLLRKVQNLENMRDSVDAEIKALQARKSDYLEQIRLLDTTNEDIYRTRQKALSQATSYVDAQIQIWQKFANIQDDIISETTDVGDKIDLFLSLIESTAIVFREGLNLLELQRNVEEAIGLFANDIPKMTQLINDMEKSWDTLDYLVTALAGVSKLEISGSK